MQAGLDSAMDDYGTENEVEFFAVASETFFETPGPLAEQEPDLYRQLCRYYCVDPLLWQEPR